MDIVEEHVIVLKDEELDATSFFPKVESKFVKTEII